MERPKIVGMVHQQSRSDLKFVDHGKFSFSVVIIFFLIMYEHDHLATNLASRTIAHWLHDDHLPSPASRPIAHWLHGGHLFLIMYIVIVRG
jgi:hypothetical protein